MKLATLQTLEITALIGALVTNNNGAEFFIAGIGVNLAEHQVILELEFVDNPGAFVGVNWDAVASWEIQLNPRLQRLVKATS